MSVSPFWEERKNNMWGCSSSPLQCFYTIFAVSGVLETPKVNTTYSMLKTTKTPKLNTSIFSFSFWALFSVFVHETAVYCLMNVSRSARHWLKESSMTEPPTTENEREIHPHHTWLQNEAVVFQPGLLQFSSLAPQCVKLNLMWMTLQLSSCPLWLKSKLWGAYLHTNTPS